MVIRCPPTVPPCQVAVTPSSKQLEHSRWPVVKIWQYSVVSESKTFSRPACRNQDALGPRLASRRLATAAAARIDPCGNGFRPGMALVAPAADGKLIGSMFRGAAYRSRDRRSVGATVVLSLRLADATAIPDVGTSCEKARVSHER